MKFDQGHTERVLIGVRNMDDRSIKVKNVTGAYTQEVIGDPLIKYAQNFSVDSFNSQVVEAGDTMTIAFEFFTFTSL